ncbi:MAG: FAD-binding oxidoreductase [Rhodobacteraceae bacterium]|nr:FAD-binding oxidoreductase [Paracoccaceae bacterium]
MTMPDVTIMGAGVFGLTLALACRERGARVQVTEARGIGAGSSGGLVGALAPHVPENWNAKKALQFDALRMAQDYWHRVQEISGIDPGYARLGRVQPVPDGGLELARGRGARADDLWQGFAQWHVLPVAEAPGLAMHAPSGWVIHDTLSARLHPRRAGQALAGAFQALGGKIVFGTAEPRGKIVWATGYEGLEALSTALGRKIGGGVKGQSLLLRHDARAAPQLFADGLHIVPHADGTIAIGSTSERDFDSPDSVDAQCDALHARALAICPALQGAPVIARWAGVRPRARSRAPLLGPWPGRAGQYVFNGGFKIGFAMAPALAQIMADLVLDGIDRVPRDFGFGAV